MPPAPPQPVPPAPVLPLNLTEGFEAGLGAWAERADVPPDPNRPGATVAWSIDPSTERAARGSASARYRLDGRQDDGTIWLQRNLSVPAGVPLELRLRAQAWSEGESFNTVAHLVLFAGPRAPVGEGDFSPPDWFEQGDRAEVVATGDTAALRQPLDLQAGWRIYALRWNAPAQAGSTLWVAVGISVVWETEVTYFVDEVQVEVARDA